MEFHHFAQGHASSWLNQNPSFLFLPNYKNKQLTNGFFLKGSFSSERGGTNWQNKGRFPLESVYEKKIWPVRIVKHFMPPFLLALIKFTRCLWLHTFLRIKIRLGILQKVSKIDFFSKQFSTSISILSFWSLEHVWLKIMWLKSSHNPDCS